MAHPVDPRPTTYSIIYDEPVNEYVVLMGPMPISGHKTEAEAKAAKKRYEAADARRAEIAP